MKYRSELGQDNGLTRNTGARCKNERGQQLQILTGGPGIFTVPTIIKLHFNPWLHVTQKIWSKAKKNQHKES